MASRLKLQAIFEDILGSRNVYFQPPTSVLLKYPCIIFNKSGSYKVNANNRMYSYTDRYEVTVIDYDPESETPKKILAQLPMCSLDGCFTKDNLNHTRLTVYF